MNPRVLPLLLALALAACNKSPEHPRADLVVRNADIRTQDRGAPLASALAVSGG